MTGHDLDLPFEEAPHGPIATPISTDSVICGGLVIRAAAIDTPMGRLPALIFDFHRVTGEPLAPVVFVNDPDQVSKLIPLVEASVTAAIAGAGR